MSFRADLVANLAKHAEMSARLRKDVAILMAQEHSFRDENMLNQVHTKMVDVEMAITRLKALVV